MSHVRQQLRDRIKTSLTGLSTTGSNVFDSRVHTIQESELPCILIYTNTETSVPYELGSAERSMKRELEFHIEAVVKGVSGYDNTLDTICAEVETAIANDVNLNGICKDVYLKSTDIRFHGEYDKPLALADMTYFLRYYTAENDAETGL